MLHNIRQASICRPTTAKVSEAAQSRKEFGSPGPKTASRPFIASSFDIASFPDDTVKPAST
jgi:hypothetical protein